MIESTISEDQTQGLSALAYQTLAETEGVKRYLPIFNLDRLTNTPDTAKISGRLRETLLSRKRKREEKITGSAASAGAGAGAIAVQPALPDAENIAQDVAAPDKRRRTSAPPLLSQCAHQKYLSQTTESQSKDITLEPQPAQDHAKLHEANLSLPFDSTAAIAADSITPESEIESDITSTCYWRYELFYRINCDSELPLDHHEAFICSDAPKRTVGCRKVHHLQAGEPVFDLEEELSEQEHVGFVIIKDTHCGGEPPTGSYGQGNASLLQQAPCQFSESMRIVSPLLRRALNLVAKCYCPEKASKDPARRLELKAPYIFLYHHRKELVALAESDDISAQVTKCLLDYLAENFGTEFAASDDLIAHRTINNVHILKLFRPNQILLTTPAHGNDGEQHVQAFVLEKWPKESESDISFDGWFYASEGSRLVRKHFSAVCYTSPHKTQEIDSLGVYPLEFATPELKMSLVTRGLVYWSLRNLRFVAYTGWDVPGETFHVCHRCNQAGQMSLTRKLERRKDDCRLPNLSQNTS